SPGCVLIAVSIRRRIEISGPLRDDRPTDRRHFGVQLALGDAELASGYQVRCGLTAGGKRIRTAGPSRKRVVSPTEREMPRERKGESRQRQLSFGAPNVRTRLPPPARLTRVTEHSLRRLLKDFELF